MMNSSIEPEQGYCNSNPTPSSAVSRRGGRKLGVESFDADEGSLNTFVSIGSAANAVVRLLQRCAR
jgi:hypothetical protein